MDAKTSTNTKTGTLTLGDKSYPFPLLDGTIGPQVMDISKLYNQAGIFTYDLHPVRGFPGSSLP